MKRKKTAIKERENGKSIEKDEGDDRKERGRIEE